MYFVTAVYTLWRDIASRMPGLAVASELPFLSGRTIYWRRYTIMDRMVPEVAMATSSPSVHNNPHITGTVEEKEEPSYNKPFLLYFTIQKY